ncbi:MAG: transporter [Muribaculaceae bacterium]|nr:transporter [Muribaculaceae bacterium]
MRTIINFLKNWTLPCAIVTGTVMYQIFAYTPALDDAARFFDPIFDTIFPFFMGMILFTTFCKVDFHKMRPAAWHWWITLLQVLLVALVAGLILSMDIAGNDLILMEGILTCIIAPGAAAAAVVTAKLGGDLETMTTYTFISNFVTALLVPTVFPMIDRGVDISFVQAFLTILYKVCMVLLVPMAAAYVVKHYLRRLHAWIVSIEDLSFYMWGISLSIVTGSTVKYIVHAGTTTGFVLTIAAISMVLCLVQFALGRYVGHFFGTTIESGQGLGQKNTAFAVWIAYTYLNPLCSVGPGCYILWQNAINSLEIWHERRAREARQAQH